MSGITDKSVFSVVCEVFSPAAGASLDPTMVEYVAAMFEDPDITAEDAAMSVESIFMDLLADYNPTPESILNVCVKILDGRKETALKTTKPRKLTKQVDMSRHIEVECDTLYGHDHQDTRAGVSRREKRARTKDQRMARRAANQAEALSQGTDLDPNAWMANDLTPAEMLAARTNPARMLDLMLEDITLTVSGSILLKCGSLPIARGHKYTIIGRNGVGKSTLLNALANRELPVPRCMRVLYVKQEVPGTRMTALEAVLQADQLRSFLKDEEARLLAICEAGELAEEAAKAKADQVAAGLLVEEVVEDAPAPTTKRGGGGGGAAARRAARRAKKSGDKAAVEEKRAAKVAAEMVQETPEEAATRLTHIYKSLQEIDADTAHTRAATILSGLGFTEKMQHGSTKSLSGGWRMRLSLAGALFTQPDLLLIDEPTNMLDLSGIIWLETYLQSYPNTVINVSHNIDFVNAFTTDIIFFDGINSAMYHYKGDYNNFKKNHDQMMLARERKSSALMAERAHIQEFIDKFRFNAKRASIVQSRIKELERMGEPDVFLRDPPVSFEFPTSAEILNPPYMELRNAAFQWSPHAEILFKNLDFTVGPKSRIGIIGPNGKGKSTLLKLLMGDVEPIHGTVFRHGKLRVARFTQHHAEKLDYNLSAVEWLKTKFPGRDDKAIRNALGKYNVSGNMQTQIIGTLSGGQKSRVLFAEMGLSNPHALVVDEIEGHLDIDVLDAVGMALKNFNGAVIMVSHNEKLIQAVATSLWVVDKGSASLFKGTLQDYKNTVLKELGQRVDLGNVRA